MKAKDLKNSILQMAVQGKLVPQDPSDEPASVLLDRIREERAHLIKEKKIKAPKGGESVIYLGSDGRRYEKRGKGEPVCIDDEIPFEIPEGWEWARLGSLLSVISDGTHKTPEYTNDGVLFLSVQNISKGFFDLSRVKHISRETHKGLCKRVRPQNGDILLCRIGTLGKPIIVDVDYEFSIFVVWAFSGLLIARLRNGLSIALIRLWGSTGFKRLKSAAERIHSKSTLEIFPRFWYPFRLLSSSAA